MNDTPTIPTSPNKEDAHIIDKVLKAIAFPIAAVTGYIAARTNLHTASYDVEKRLGSFDDILEKHTPLSKANSKAFIEGAIDKKTYLTRAYDLKNSYSKAVYERMNHMGLDKFSSEWRHVSRNQRLTAIINALTVSGVAVGALLTIADNRWLSSKFDKEEKDQDKNGNSRC